MMTANLPNRIPAAAQPSKSVPWRLIFRSIRWISYATAVVALVMVFHKAPAPLIETSPQAASRAEQKIADVEQAVSTGRSATLRMDQTELNSYLTSHLDIAPSAAHSATPATTSDNSAANPAAGLATPSGTSAEQIEQVRSQVKDVKVQLIEDRVRAYVVFDFYGKDLTLQLEGRLGANKGYLHFAPTGGQLGSLPIPQSTLEAAVQRLMDSPENREKLKLPAEVSDLRIDNGEIVATYR
jgi:hypothetical protein